jgi:hypothetical protein
MAVARYSGIAEPALSAAEGSAPSSLFVIPTERRDLLFRLVGGL